MRWIEKKRKYSRPPKAVIKCCIFHLLKFPSKLSTLFLGTSFMLIRSPWQRWDIYFLGLFSYLFIWKSIVYRFSLKLDNCKHLNGEIENFFFIRIPSRARKLLLIVSLRGSFWGESSPRGFSIMSWSFLKDHSMGVETQIDQLSPMQLPSIPKHTSMSQENRHCSRRHTLSWRCAPWKL